MNNIQKLVDDTLSSLDDTQRAEANPYLYTRIEQRLKNRYAAAPSYQKKLMPVLAIALVLFISINVVSLFKVNTTDTSASKKSASGIENFANEYNLSEETGL
jgi:hypothetical protein